MPEAQHISVYKPENKMVGVVLLGAFNPLMFQPNWFGVNEVISQSEIDAIISNKANPCCCIAVLIANLLIPFAFILKLSSPLLLVYE